MIAAFPHCEHTMPAASKPTDHRPRVAAERRERMRRRLVETAMIVFAEKGVGASVIPDVKALAEVADKVQ